VLVVNIFEKPGRVCEVLDFVQEYVDFFSFGKIFPEELRKIFRIFIE
jgi:hypothetical protein